MILMILFCYQVTIILRSTATIPLETSVFQNHVTILLFMIPKEIDYPMKDIMKGF